jgi:hypothetical protein
MFVLSTPPAAPAPESMKRDNTGYLIENTIDLL